MKEEKKDIPFNLRRDLFRAELRELINKYSMEIPSNTPDFMLADYLIRCLNTYELTVLSSALWRGGNK